MNRKIIIIGARSNFSNYLNKYIKGCILISTKEIDNLEEKIKKLNNIDFIYNTSFHSKLLNSNETNPVEYSNYSFHYLSKFVNICNKYHSKINSIIYTSSCAVYGDNSFAKENDEIKIRNLYASLKASSEYLIEKYLGSKDIRLIYARLFNLYGGNDNFSVVSKIIYAAQNNTPFCLINNGKNIRDFIYINDAVKIYKLILDSNFSGKINISSGHGTEIQYIIDLAEITFHKKIKIINKVNNDVFACVGCNDKITNKLKFNDFRELKYFFESNSISS